MRGRGATISWDADADHKGKALTSAQGDCVIPLGDKPLDGIMVKASKPGMVPLLLFWNQSENAPRHLPTISIS